jgi:hypothetical protein
VAPPRRRNRRRPARVVNAPPAVVHEPEPAPPPRRGLLASLLGPSAGAGARPAPRAAPALLEGPPWTRPDYYVLSGLAALIVVVVGLLLGGFSGAANAQVTTSAVKGSSARTVTPTTSQFTVVASDGTGAGAGLAPGEPITVGNQSSTVGSLSCDTVTLANPLSSPPAANTPVSQGLALPFTPTGSSVVAQVRANPKPSTKQFTVNCDASQFAQGDTVRVGSSTATVSSVSGSTITLSSALPQAPSAGTEVSLPYGPSPGSLLGDMMGLIVGELAIVILPLAALVARPLAARLRHKPRPRTMETIFFGAAIWVVDSLIYEIVSSQAHVGSVGALVAVLLFSAASGFLIVPAIYPPLARMLRPRPRAAPASDGRGSNGRGPSGRR